MPCILVCRHAVWNEPWFPAPRLGSGRGLGWVTLTCPLVWSTGVVVRLNRCARAVIEAAGVSRPSALRGTPCCSPVATPRSGGVPPLATRTSGSQDRCHSFVSRLAKRSLSHRCRDADSTSDSITSRFFSGIGPRRGRGRHLDGFVNRT